MLRYNVVLEPKKTWQVRIPLGMLANMKKCPIVPAVVCINVSNCHLPDYGGFTGYFSAVGGQLHWLSPTTS